MKELSIKRTLSLLLCLALMLAVCAGCGETKTDSTAGTGEESGKTAAALMPKDSTAGTAAKDSGSTGSTETGSSAAGLADRGSTRADKTQKAAEVPDDGWHETPDGSGDDYIITTKLQFRSAPALVYDEMQNAAGQEYCYTAVKEYGEWSEWGEDALDATETCDVERRTLYHYRQLLTYAVSMAGRVATATGYYWSDWMDSEEEVKPSSSCEVEEKYQYRAREIVLSYYYVDSSAWSEWSDTPIAPADGIVVQTRTLYYSEPRSEASACESGMQNFGYYFTGVTLADVDAGKWYTDKVYESFESGIMAADDYLFFRPNDEITVLELARAAVMIARTYQGEEGYLTDEECWNYAIACGIAGEEGVPYDGFVPDAPAARAQAALMFANALPAEELTQIDTVTAVTDLEDANFGGEMYANAILLLAGANVISNTEAEFAFRPDDSITRAEASAIISNLIFPSNRPVG